MCFGGGWVRVQSANYWVVGHANTLGGCGHS